MKILEQHWVMGGWVGRPIIFGLLVTILYLVVFHLIAKTQEKC